MSLLEAGRRVTLAIVATLAPSLAVAEDAGGLVIQHPWLRATPGGAQVAGGYVTIVNRGARPDTLTGGSLEGAAALALHVMTNDSGVMRMRPAGPLAIPPGGSLTLSPAGTHIMVTGLHRALKPGEDVAGTLTFSSAGAVPVRFHVEGVAAMAPSDMGGMAMPGIGRAGAKR